jgi:hypothetical protein
MHPDTRELIVELCRQFYELGWVTGTGGSIRYHRCFPCSHAWVKVQTRWRAKLTAPRG